MIGVLGVILFIGLMSLGVPIAFVIGIVALFGIYFLGDISMITVIQKMFRGLNSFVLVSIPLFILAANLMNHGKISDKLIQLAVALVGHIRGGLAHSNVVVSMFFAGISGSSTAEAAAIGKVMIPNMVKENYRKETAVAVTACASTIGVIIPPSIPMVIYGSLAGASIGALFLGGVLPGILIGFGMMALTYFVAKKYNYPKTERKSVREIVRLILVNIPPLMTPAIIIGGIVGGLTTPTEAAVLACIYAFVLSKFFYRTLKWSDLPGILKETLLLSSLSLFALSTASALGELLSYYRVSEWVANVFTSGLPYPWLFMTVVIALFLFLGTFMDAIPAMILFVPVLVPAAQSLGIDPVHLGIVVVITLAIGLVTPPYGLCLLLSASIAKLELGRAFMAALPYLAVMLAVTLMMAFMPDLAMFLPNLLQ